MAMSKPTAGDRLAQAAFDLFNERGYEQTTVDDIAERAGLGRATFFRHYRAKEDVIFPDHDRLLEQVSLQVEVQAKYSGYLKRQTDEIDRQHHNEELRLPLDIDYAEVGGLSNEARQRLSDLRPATLGQAARIPGLTPAAVSLLLVHLKKRHHAA